MGKSSNFVTTVHLMGKAVKLVAVAAHSEPPSPKHESVIRGFVKSLLEYCGEKPVLLVGGYWGFMRVLVDEAVNSGLTVILFPPVEKEEVEFPENAVVLRTGLSFRLRSVAMVRSSDAVVVLGGSSGTLQELVTAYTEGKPVFMLLSGLATDRAASLAPYLDGRKLSEIRVYHEVGDLAKDLCRYIADVRVRPLRFG